MTAETGETSPNYTRGEALIHVENPMTAPTLVASQLLGNRYNQPELNHLFDQRFTQTPLGPFDIYESNIPYNSVAMHILEKRVYTLAELAALSGERTMDILNEVYEEHSRRMKGNSHAKDRLREILGETELTQEEANLIWRALIGVATMCETGNLLLHYPGMESIEAAKYTQPLDFRAYDDMANHVNQQLAQYAQKADTSVTVYDTADDRRQIRSMVLWTDETDELRPILGYKDNIAEVTDGNKTIQLVRKQTLIALPTTENLKFTVPNYKQLGDTTFNVQPIAFSCYWRSLPVIPHQ